MLNLQGKIADDKYENDEHENNAEMIVVALAAPASPSTNTNKINGFIHMKRISLFDF